MAYENRDYTHLSENEKQKIELIAQAIRNKAYGIDVRESIALAIEWVNREYKTTIINNELTLKEFENAKSKVANLELDMDEFIKRYSEQVAGNTSLDETIDARVDATGVSHTTLKDRLDKEQQEVTTQLAQTEERTVFNSNAKSPLFIETYDGFNQPVHPDALHFENGWSGYNYWLAYTPYPWTNDFYENPSIAVSNDGIKWTTPVGFENPLDKVTQEQNDNGEHLSDTALVFNHSLNQLECWWRWRNKTTNEERLYRRTTADGKNWTEKELVYNQGTDLVVSPTVHFENGIYKMWVVTRKNNYSLEYTETATPSNVQSWTDREIVPISFAKGTEPATIWHSHIYKEHNNLYHLTFNERLGSIYWGTSTDGKSFSDTVEIIRTPRGGNTWSGAWDGRELYKPTLVKVGDLYRVYYSAHGSSPSRWNIGLTEGTSMLNLQGSKNIANDGYQIINRTKGWQSYYKQFIGEHLELTTPEGETVYIKLTEKGKWGAGVQLIDYHTLRITEDNPDKGKGNIDLNRLIANEITTEKPHLPVNANLYIDRPSGENPTLTMRSVSDHSVKLVSTEPNFLEVKNEAETFNGHMKIAGLVFSGNTSLEREGQIKYNSTLKKHQGFDGTTWHDLY